MKIFSVSQIKAWDAYTIANEPIKSIALMERAAVACFNWLIQNFDKKTSFKIFCSKGNNGGDGLAIARLLSQTKHQVSVYIIGEKKTGTPDFEANLKRLKRTSSEIILLNDEKSFPALSNEDVIIDALFGTGLNKKPRGLIASLIEDINANKSEVISIDVPSGLYIDNDSEGNPILNAEFTLTFQNQKLAYLIPENEKYFGKVVLLDIGLSNEFETNEPAQFDITDKDLIRQIYQPRKAFTNKGNYGYACLLAGSYGMMGAAVLSAKACLRSGVGKLTCFICESGYNIVQTSVPEAMCKVFGDEFVKAPTGFENFDVIGIGPGIGQHASHKTLLKDLFTSFKKPLVIDADALNMLSKNQNLYKLLPANGIITPHPKEFERLFGSVDSGFERIQLALVKAKELNIFIVLKGHHTFIATPHEKGYFNSTGNSGMATAGSGDVLTGIITGLLAQKYSSLDACILGVYLHGLAGDIAANVLSKEALIAGDIVDHLGDAFKEIVTN
jgi:NAD(P)H-hydrate epimerase